MLVLTSLSSSSPCKLYVAVSSFLRASSWRAAEANPRRSTVPADLLAAAFPAARKQAIGAAVLGSWLEQVEVDDEWLVVVEQW